VDRLTRYFKISGEVEWGVNRFPDGQIQFWIEEPSQPAKLWASLADSECLDLFLQMVARVPFDSVQINYLYGARSDKDSAGSRSVTNVAKMILRCIEAIGSSQSVTIVSPHCSERVTSQVAIWPIHPQLLANEPGYGAILFPDGSARSRFQDILPDLPFLECSKEQLQPGPPQANSQSTPRNRPPSCLVVTAGPRRSVVAHP